MLAPSLLLRLFVAFAYLLIRSLHLHLMLDGDDHLHDIQDKQRNGEVQQVAAVDKGIDQEDEDGEQEAQGLRQQIEADGHFPAALHHTLIDEQTDGVKEKQQPDAHGQGRKEFAPCGETPQELFGQAEDQHAQAEQHDFLHERKQGMLSQLIHSAIGAFGESHSSTQMAT